MTQTTYVPNSYDLEVLAEAHLTDHLSYETAIMIGGVHFGSSDRNQSTRSYEHFNKVIDVLGEEKKRKIIDLVEWNMKRKYEDYWEVYKYTCKAGFFSKPANISAIERVAEKIPKDKWLLVSEYHSFDFVEAIKKALRLPKNGECPFCMASIGELHSEGCCNINCTSCGKEFNLCGCPTHTPEQALWQGE